MGAQYLQAASLYDQADQVALRQEVMGRLSELAKRWVRLVTQELGLGEHMVSEANAEIFTFGSYRLGVHGPGMPPCCLVHAERAVTMHAEYSRSAGADIDALCVGPRHVTREQHFFGSAPYSLLKMLEVRLPGQRPPCLAWLSERLPNSLWRHHLQDSHVHASDTGLVDGLCSLQAEA